MSNQKIDFKKKKFIKPELKSHGPISKISQTLSKGGPGDGGSAPGDRRMCLTPPPSIVEHRYLLNDSFSQDAFAANIAKTVKPGDVVLDLGTGSGIHAFLAIKAKAKHVYAVDSDHVLGFAEKSAQTNSLTEKITFINSDFKDLILPQKVDVIIANIGFLQSLNDLPEIAAKHLRPGGKMIPDALRLTFTPVSCESFYNTHINSWDDEKLGFDFSPLRDMAVHHPLYLHFKGDEKLSPSWQSDKIPLQNPASDNLSWQFETTITKSGICHGLGGWYSFETENKTIISTEPPLRLSPEIWSHFLLSLETPISVTAGDTISAEVHLVRKGPNNNPIWSWKVQHNNNTAQIQSGFKIFDILIS